jgi:hypothetical protein
MSNYTNTLLGIAVLSIVALVIIFHDVDVGCQLEAFRTLDINADCKW